MRACVRAKVLGRTDVAFYSNTQDKERGSAATAVAGDEHDAHGARSSQHQQHDSKNRGSGSNSRRAPALRIPLRSVISVQPVHDDVIPIMGFSYFQIETFPRVYYLMVRSDIQVQDWMEGFVHHLGSEVLHSPFETVAHVLGDIAAGSVAGSRANSRANSVAGSRRGTLQDPAQSRLEHDSTETLSSPNKLLDISQLTADDEAETETEAEAKQRVGAVSASFDVDVSNVADAGLLSSLLAEDGVTQALLARFQDPQGMAGLVGEAYLAKSDCWRLDKKRIFNYRRIVFHPASLPALYHQATPNELIERILGTALQLSRAADLEQQQVGVGVGIVEPDSAAATGSESGAGAGFCGEDWVDPRVTAVRWVRFMDELSWLQTVDVSQLSEPQRAAFFLNLYHVMVLHGGLIVGFPPGWSHWNAFFNHITYLFSYEIISASDIEHNILKYAHSSHRRSPPNSCTVLISCPLIVVLY